MQALSYYQSEASQGARAVSAVTYVHDRELDQWYYIRSQGLYHAGPIILSK